MKFTFKEGIITNYLNSVFRRWAASLGMVTFILLGIFGHSYAQQRAPLPPMSLQDIRAEINEMESAEDKLQHYLEMSNRYLRNAPDSMLLVSEEIKDLEGIDEQKKEAFSLFIAASAWRVLDSDSAIHYGRQASEKLRELNEHNSYLTIENLRATQLTIQRDYVQAESLYINAISYRENVKEEVDFPIHYFYGNLGNLYVNVGAHDLAITMYEKFLEYADNPQDRCNILSKLSNSFTELGDVDKGIELLNPCLEFENLPPPIQAIVRGNLSHHYEKKGDPERSLALLEDAASITTQYRIPNIGNANLVRLGDRYLEMDMVQKADSVAQMLNTPPTGYMRPHEQITRSKFQASLAFSKGDFEESIAFADRAIDMADQHDLDMLLSDIYSIKADAYERLGELTLALENQRLQRELDLRQNELTDNRKMEMQNVRYQMQNKEAQLLALSTQLEDVKAQTILMISTLIMISGYIFYRYRIYYLLREERTRTRIAMDLHDDLSGTLSSISFFSKAAMKEQIRENTPRRFLNIIDQSAAEAKEKINDIIWAIDPSKDDWSVFLKKCKRYAADTFDSKDIDYNIEVDDTFSFPVELEVRQNLWLIFKESINNLVRHSEATHASVIFKQVDNSIELIIEDNGKGFQPDMIKKGNGIKNLRARSEAISGEMKIESVEKKGTRLQFKFILK